MDITIIIIDIIEADIIIGVFNVVDEIFIIIGTVEAYIINGLINILEDIFIIFYVVMSLTKPVIVRIAEGVIRNKTTFNGDTIITIHDPHLGKPITTSPPTCKKQED